MPSIDPDAGIPSMKWPIEAENLRTDALKFIYRTEDDEIDNFLQTEGKFFVCGLKGLGKTLALRAKKKTYIELARGDSELSYGYTLIPEEELDVLPSLQPSGGYLDLLEKIDLWKDIWGLAIGLSIISYFIDTKYDERYLKRRIEDLFEFQIEMNQKDKTFLTLLSDTTVSNKSGPCAYVTKIFNLFNRTMYNKKILSKLHNDVYNLVMESIESQCAIFIDQVDKSWEDVMSNYYDPKNIHKLERLQNIWYSCQIGLIKAIDEYVTRKHHLKIYSAFRQEILGKLKEDPNYLRYLDKMLILSYKKEHLRGIFKKAIKIFEPKNNLSKPEKIDENIIEAFLGLREVKPFRIQTNETEDIFDYMYRHSIQRPRDIFFIVSGIVKALTNRTII